MRSGSHARCSTLLSLLSLLATAGAQQPEARSPAETEVAARLTAARSQLAKAAFDLGLLREAGSLAGAILRVEPNHAIASLTARMKSLGADEFVRTYREAALKNGKAFRKRARSELEPIAGAMYELGASALAAGDTETAERNFAGAYEVDPDHPKALAALLKLDYDAIFNYGVLPKSEKQEARKLLRALGGGFLGRGDLAAELENWVDAWGLQTRHYRFVANAPHSTVFAFARACEDLYDALDAFLTSSKQSLRTLNKPSTVYLFRSKVDYECILRLQGVEPADSEAALGFYYSGTKIGYFYYDHEFYAGDTTSLCETFFHEGAHQQFDLRLKTAWRGKAQGPPLHWVEEGLATYLESLVAKDSPNGRSGKFGTIVDNDLAIAIDAIGKGALMPMQQFAHVQKEKWDEYAEAYQQAALVVHWLLEANGGKRKDVALELLVAERQNGGLRKGTFFDLVGMPAAEVDAALKEHAARIGRELPRREYK
jgi:hypothetical protein